MVKKYVILIVLLLFASFTYSQIVERRKCDQEFHHSWINLPIFDKNYLEDNSWEKLFEFLRENLQYPETAKADKIEGQVFVEFWIDTAGFTSEHEIIQSIRQDLDDEALRVAKLIKFDVPATHYNGKPLEMCFQFPIRFTLNENKPSRNCLKSSEKDKPKHKSNKKNSNDNK